ncbi:hypothetical protein VM1G_04384 [Cytospora mali]|uniref:SigF-like NTF2-like domain-containing protein n=1 Tax=Cytospora mali TaxID=578113 RepID=A0A194VWQ5_CYTMA|nr:hypothetical protein VM1G_04384 [Valsa mali]
MEQPSKKPQQANTLAISHPAVMILTCDLEHEIQYVVRSLCQGTPDEQRRTLDRYFTPDAEFVHPFCVVPRFNRGALKRVPLLNKLSSRDVVRGVYQWYRMLSPKIEMEFDSVLLDRARDKIFLDIRQTFSVWFIPMYHAHVRLVTVLDLVPCDPSRHDDGEPLAITRQGEGGEGDNNNNNNSNSNSNSNPHYSDDYYDDETTATSTTLAGSYPPGVPAQPLWRISRQEDLYQVNEFLKFVGPFWWCVWRLLWAPFQLGATAACVFLSLFVALSPWAYQKEPAAGGVEATIEQVEVYYDDAKNGKSSSRGSKGRTSSSPSRKHAHSKGRKKSSR